MMQPAENGNRGGLRATSSTARITMTRMGSFGIWTLRSLAVNSSSARFKRRWSIPWHLPDVLAFLGPAAGACCAAVSPQAAHFRRALQPHRGSGRTEATILSAYLIAILCTTNRASSGQLSASSKLSWHREFESAPLRSARMSLLHYSSRSGQPVDCCGFCGIDFYGAVAGRASCSRLARFHASLPPHPRPIAVISPAVSDQKARAAETARISPAKRKPVLFRINCSEQTVLFAI